ncbi:hypothetical protein BAD_0633 [Bifidobacterium adolescentis ATCC 15703]|uniref:Uncharacterized protein n=1 Tax=Bifidobacterium adolescentis (strain ATCC 15703 / DSM 20083 / NCTC 11814 / E194a) TaxID=367928 RepID=A1A131_BIFAA|nr:hypothetical protein BAD_0633 [Bifidobacterium adolescentis ATCC 15703]
MVGPGHTQVTVTPVPRNSWATASDSERTNAFDAKYIAMYGPAIIEATDEIFKILPCPLARMSRPYRYVNSASACMLSCIISFCRFQSASRKSVQSAKPALLTRWSTAIPCDVVKSWSFFGAFASLRSMANVTTCTPKRCSSLVFTMSSRSWLRAVITRSCPSAANSAASSRPMPPDAPVMSAYPMPTPSFWSYLAYEWRIRGSA